MNRTCRKPNPRTANVASTLLWSSLLLGAALVACGQSNPKSPGLENMGAPEISWADKNTEQRFGFMAAVVHPKMGQMFGEYHAMFKTSFTCETCHGKNPDLIDYKMPSDELYALPKENTLEESNEYDAAATEFMLKVVTPKLQEMLNQGEGPKTQVTCFSCHPVDG